MRLTDFIAGDSVMASPQAAVRRREPLEYWTGTVGTCSLDYTIFGLLRHVPRLCRRLGTPLRFEREAIAAAELNKDHPDVLAHRKAKADAYNAGLKGERELPPPDAGSN